MKRYQINENELDFLSKMMEYLSSKDNEMSDEGRQQVKEVLDRISSRPVLETIIDPKVFQTEGTENDH